MSRRRQCVSLDETAIHRCHGKYEESSGVLSSGEQSPERRLKEFPGPAQPPFLPPERVKTPEGIPSWRGEVWTTIGNRVAPESSTTQALFRQLRARSSQMLRQIFGGPSNRIPSRFRIWRPPVSGHRAQTFGQLESHPFTTAPVAEVGHDTPGEDVSNQHQKSPVLNTQRSGQIIERGNVPAHQIEAQSERPDSNAVCAIPATLTRVQSPSQRALQAASGSAIPVSPQRARKYAQASINARSISVPNACWSQVNQANTCISRPLPVPNGTVNTTELIQQFPEPPNQPNRSTLQNDRAYPAVFSIFPPHQEPGQDERAIQGGVRHSSGKGGKRRIRSDAISISTPNTDRSGKQRAADSCTVQQPPSNNAASDCGNEVSVVTAIQVHSNEPSIRGESLCRYRHSGTPVYDNDVSSLRSFDEERERNENRLLPPHMTALPRPASALTGNSRYFSATSTSLGTRVMSIRLASGQERDRAVANGALRFVSSHNDALAEVSPEPSVISSSPTRNDENNFPITPVTVTQASKKDCRHRLRQMQIEEGHRMDRLGFDGSSPPPEQGSPLDTQPTDESQVSRPAALHFQPSLESFGHRHHISRRIKSGTWRTRMKKTKCWRCEIESRRTASRVELHRGYRYCIDGWPDRWSRLKENLKWTCFCRYRGYDEDSDDPAEVEHRARLGRFGGSLSEARRY